MTKRRNVELNDSGKKILAAGERAPYDTDRKAEENGKAEGTEEDKLAGDPPTELMRILSTLFSKKMPYQKKIDRLTELGIVLTEEMKKGINVMCNLSEGIFEAGVAQERAETERERARAERERARADKLQAENEELRAQLEMMKKDQR